MMMAGLIILFEIIFLLLTKGKMSNVTRWLLVSWSMIISFMLVKDFERLNEWLKKLFRMA